MQMGGGEATAATAPPLATFLLRCKLKKNVGRITELYVLTVHSQLSLCYRIPDSRNLVQMNVDY